MDSRRRVQRTLAFEEVDRPPRDLWVLPEAATLCLRELEEVRRKYPPDFAAPRFRYGRGRRQRGEAGKEGAYVDAWGSVWQVLQPGSTGQVKEFPLSDWQRLHTYKVPWELLEEADFSQVDESCGQSRRYILARTQISPFERMQFLRGTEKLLLDLAYGGKEVYTLRDMLHEFFLREAELWARTAVDGVSFLDDWGSQTAMLISPALWRAFFKPLYRDYCDILHRAGKAVFFHSDGNIEEIYPDLIEIGVNAVNSQLFCMDYQSLGALYAGKIVFWGEVDRQRLLPLGTPEEVRSGVEKLRAALGRRGVIAQCQLEPGVPQENIEAVFAAWQEEQNRMG